MELGVLKEMAPWEWPEGTDDVLLGILRDGGAGAEDRLVAAEMAGDSTVINDELALALLSLGSDGAQSEELRRTAVISLGPVLEQSDNEGFDEDSLISEKTFRALQKSLRALYGDAGVPSEVRRAVLEAAVRAPQKWHADAVRGAYAGGDEAWKLTAVFCMRYLREFDGEILDALKSGNEEIHFQAVCAAGEAELDEAWPHVSALVCDGKTTKELRIAAIYAAAAIRPDDAEGLLCDLAGSDDEEIAEAASEALDAAEFAELLDESDEDDGEWRPKRA